MDRQTKPLTELKRLLNDCLREQPGCQDCQLHAVCVHRPDHTGCNWSAEVDFPGRSEEEAVRGLPLARGVVVMVRERFNVERMNMVESGLGLA
ncbi:hypothetical protein OR16_18076 [Cupriavidus basilensis OR16]|uniref:Uncharacterized protein n=1 Tax=Cupriavidus basilensis OR16 TaxID=1127483 RepID=H1S6R9_9BURK|nr:hypothetical protein [Cupriavidus basilensis]EHP41730.1 hypothetical protein OR16_18076 [Cupriavidus basilensis OR16]